MELGERDYLVPWDKPRCVPRPGDFFALRTGKGMTLLGRVASIGSRLVPDEPKSAEIVYIYPPAVAIEPLPEFLAASRIWIGPTKVMPMLWSQRYFTRVGRRAPLPGELLRSHRFWMGWPDEIRDEHGRLMHDELPERMGHAGNYLPMGIARTIKERMYDLPDMSTPPRR